MRTALVAALIIVAVQTGSAQPVASDPPPAVDEEYKPDPNEAFIPAKLDSEGKSIVAGLNRFGLNLYGKLRAEKGDLAVSPASISTAFGLAYAGAKGQTAAEIAATLHYPAASNFHTNFGGLLKTMELHRNGRTLAVNNALWLQDGMAVHADYVGLVERNYGAGLQRVDYRSDSEAARLKINGWVESKTKGKIRNLLSPDNVTPLTRSVLVNTIYFKADWADPFDAEDTREEDFALSSGRTIKRQLMHEQGRFAYVEGHGVKALAMPYRGGETEMILFLPDRPSGLAGFERSLDAAALDDWLEKLGMSAHPTVNVTLPRFRIEKRFEMKKTLEELGMRVPFSNQSDFSGAKIVNPVSADVEEWNLKISDVIHQVFVEVEEKGTEAAAATAITSIIVTGARRKDPPREFRADHPFLFLIRDRRTGAVLFIGRFTGE